MGKDYTTGQVAEIFSVSIPTVHKWCREGRIGYFKTPGGKKGSGHIRITQEAVRGMWQTYYIGAVEKKEQNDSINKSNIRKT